MINYLTIFKCTPSAIRVSQSVRSFSSLHQCGSRVILRDSKNVINRKFHLTNFSNNKNAADKAKAKAKLRTSDIKRLLSLAKPEKWKIAGENLKISLK